jgi:hypothetical protein
LRQHAAQLMRGGPLLLTTQNPVLWVYAGCTIECVAAGPAEARTVDELGKPRTDSHRRKSIADTAAVEKEIQLLLITLPGANSRSILPRANHRRSEETSSGVACRKCLSVQRGAQSEPRGTQRRCFGRRSTKATRAQPLAGAKASAVARPTSGHLGKVGCHGQIADAGILCGGVCALTVRALPTLRAGIVGIT